VLGIVIHEALERLADQPLPLSLTDYIAAEQDRWQASARRHDLTPDDELAVVEATACQLTGVLEDREGRWLLEAHPQGQAELPVTAVIDGEIQNLIIDRTFVTNGVRWVVDYKTAMPPAGVDLDAFISEELSRYRGQLSRYATAAEGLFEEIPTLAIYFTAVPCLARLPA
jgi:ATP-dependent exoDNAse (exonuclease V) beta subunit